MPKICTLSAGGFALWYWLWLVLQVFISVPAVAVEDQTCLADHVLTLINGVNSPGWISNQAVVRKFDSNINPSAGEPTRLLLEYHCFESIVKSFVGNQEEVVSEAYVFPVPEAAYGAYTVLHGGSSNVITVGDASSEDDRSISLWQDCWYIHLYTTGEGSNESKSLLKKLASVISYGIGQHALLPTLLSSLPILDRVSGTERFIMGTEAAHRVTSIPFVGMLCLDKSHGAVTADYQFRYPQKERMQMMIVDYQDHQLASQIFDAYLYNLDDLNIERQNGNTYTFYRMSGRYLLCQLKGARIVVIAGARKKNSLFELCNQTRN